MRVLCIDIGATRIKWSVLQSKPSLTELESATVGSMRSLGWLNGHLEDILDEKIWGAIVQPDRHLANFDRVAVSICCGVEPNTQKLCGFHVDKHGVPPDLKEKFQRRVGGRPIELRNDAEAWLRGAVTIAGMKKIVVEWPAIALSFGTGVGFAIAHGPAAVKPREFIEPFSPRQISRVAGFTETVQSWKVHEILGKPFFEWVERDQSHWSYSEVRKAYTDRLLGLLEDLANQIVRPMTLFVGGGNSEFISVRQIEGAMKICTIPMSKATLGRMNPDIIPLLGLLENC